MHYRTFPVLESSAENFIKLVKEKAPKVKIVALKPGDTYQV
jgi:L-ascorbate metabolism protein UlaG (beta-lactamase superfamily)